MLIILGVVFALATIVFIPWPWGLAVGSGLALGTLFEILAVLRRIESGLRHGWERSFPTPQEAERQRIRTIISSDKVPSDNS